MKVPCPSCEQMLALPDDALGRQGRCPRCGAIFHVGQASAESLASVTTASTDQAAMLSLSEASNPRPQKDSLVNRSSTSISSDRSPFAIESGARFQASAADPLATWELRIGDGRTFGPVNRETLDQWVREGRVGLDASVRPMGERDWTPARILYPYLRQVAVPPVIARSARTAWNQRETVRPARGGWILFGSLLGWLCFISAPIAFAVGMQDLIEMRQGRRDRRGFGMTLAGVVISGLILSSKALTLLSRLVG